MPINLSALAGKMAHTEVNFMGHKSKITYDPLFLTADNINKMQSGKDEDFTEGFCTLVKSWDVKRGNAKVPLTSKALTSVPLVLLQAIFQAILADGADGAEEEGKASSDG